MAHNFIEHVNITVSNPDRTADYLMRIFDWHIRWRGHAAKGGHTIHVGNDQFYLAVYALALRQSAVSKHQKGRPLNHIGIVVDDLADIERRVIAEGFVPFSHDDYDPGRRFYFFDHDGIEFEVICYG